MSEKYKNKYRIASSRLQNWDYGSNGAYFITICTHNREHFFGTVLLEPQFIATLPQPAQQATMQLNEIGQLAQEYWLEIPHQFTDVELGNFIVMPNHVHGILMINKTDASPPPPLDQAGGFAGIKNPMLHENVSRMIRWYKGRCTFEMRKIRPDFTWQSRFHDHIIRDAQSFETIQNYIADNPAKWGQDTFNG